MRSLREYFPNLKDLALELSLDAENVLDKDAKITMWMDMKSLPTKLIGHYFDWDQYGVFKPIRSSATGFPLFRDTVIDLLQAAKDHGPGKCQMFRLSIDKEPEPEAEEDYYERFEGYPDGFDVGQWKPWVRESNKIYFDSLDDVSGVLGSALKSCKDTGKTREHW